MAKNELFENLSACRIPLTQNARLDVAQKIIKRAKLSDRYFYSLKETCYLLQISKDELNTLIKKYHIDVVPFLAVYRIPWYDLAAYLVCYNDNNELERSFYAWIKSNRKPKL